MTKSLTDIWDELASLTNEEAGIRIKRVVPKQFQVYAGWSVVVAQPALVFVVPTSEYPEHVVLPKAAGLEVKVTPIKPGRNGEVRITVEAQDDQYKELFPILVEDVHKCILSATTENELITLAISRLNHWQSFLKRYSGARLSEHQQVGLWGELRFLCDRLIPFLGADAAVDAWQGPLGGNQDYAFKGIAVEIKTTSSNPHEKVQISNIRQLDSSGLEALYLYHLAVIIHRESGTSLPNLIGEVEKSLASSPFAIQKFNEKLIGMGYLKSDSECYEHTGYYLLAEHVYEVREGFPRIDLDQVPNGVGDVKYSIVVSSCSNFEVDSETFIGGDVSDE